MAFRLTHLMLRGSLSNAIMKRYGCIDILATFSCAQCAMRQHNARYCNPLKALSIYKIADPFHLHVHDDEHNE